MKSNYSYIIQQPFWNPVFPSTPMSLALTNLGNDNSNLSIQSAQETFREEIPRPTTLNAPESKKKPGRKGLNLKKTWSNEKIEILIRLCTEWPVLYNSSLPEYMDKKMTDRLLETIASNIKQLCEQYVTIYCSILLTILKFVEYRTSFGVFIKHKHVTRYLSILL